LLALYLLVAGKSIPDQKPPTLRAGRGSNSFWLSANSVSEQVPQSFDERFH
jgi:hypothetical protein